MRRMALVVLVGGCTLSEAPGSATAPQAGGIGPAVALSAVAPSASALSTQSGTYDVAVVFDPARPEMGALFDVVATVVDHRTRLPLVDGKVTLNARMPQHGHGMETDPAQDAGQCDKDPRCPHPDGVYRTKGFKFHMGGSWTVTIEVVGASGTDSTSFVYEMK